MADVSIVHRTEARAFPNPNVVFELGLVAAQVGWARIILVSNDVHGQAEDQPFDYRGRSMCRYRLRPQNLNGDRRNFETALTGALQAIREGRPARPRELDRGTEASVRRGRDVAQLRRYLAQVNRAVLDENLERGPNQRLASAVLLFDFATLVVSSVAF